MSEKYVEQYPLVLPALVDGVTQLGDLWDCRTSTRVPGSLLPSSCEVDIEHLTAIPKQEQDYKMTYVKNTDDKTTSLTLGFSASVDLLVTTKTVGSISVTISNLASLTREEVIVNYDEETFVVRLRPSAQKQMELHNPTLMDQLKRGECPAATHVVTEVTIGAEVFLTLIFEQTINRQFLDSTATGLGKLVVGIISKMLEAGLSAVEGLNGNKRPTTTICLESAPKLDTKEDMNVAEAFEMIRSIRSKMNNDVFPQFGNTAVRGVPLRFFLVPISHFLPDIPKRDPVFRQIESGMLAVYRSMMNTLNDFGYNQTDVKAADEDTQPQIIGFLKKSIANADFRLKQMLYDHENPFTIKVEGDEKPIQECAKQLYEEGRDFYENFANGRKTVNEFHLLLENYDKNEILSPTRIAMLLDRYVKEGKALLARVRAGDVDDEVKAEFLTSETHVSKWKSESLSGFKLFVEISEEPDQDPPRGVLLAIYHLSKQLPTSSVAVAMPNVHPSGSDVFSIEMWAVDKWERVPVPFGAGAEEYMHALDVIACALGLGAPTLSRFYQVLVAVGIEPNIPRLVLPLTAKTMHHLYGLIENLNELCTEIVVCEDFASLRDQVQQNLKKWTIVITVEALDSVVESIRAFFKLKHFLNSSSDASWVVASFELNGPMDAPLVFVFEGDLELVAVCHDALDLYLLMNHFSGGTKSHFEILSPNASVRYPFYNARQGFGNQVATLFKKTYMMGPTPMPLPVGLVKCEIVEHATTVVRGLANCVDPDRAVLSALAGIAVIRYPTLQQKLKGIDWSEAHGSFSGKVEVSEPAWTSALYSDLLDFIFSQSEFLSDIGIAYRTLEECIKALDKPKANAETRRSEKEADADPPPPLPFDPKSEIQYIFDLLTESDDMENRTEIENIWDNADLEPGIKYIKISNLLATSVIDTHKKGECEWEDFWHLRHLLDLTHNLILEYSVDQEEELSRTETKWDFYYRTKERTFLRDIAVDYVRRIDASLNTQEILGHIMSGSTCQAIELLAALRFENWLLTLHNTFHLLQDCMEEDLPAYLKGLIWSMTAGQFDTDKYRYVWRNPKFQSLMGIGVLDKGVVDELILHQCKGSTVPPWIPSKIAIVLRGAMLELEAGLPRWGESKWTDVAEVLEIWQSIATADNGHALPPHFMQVLRTNFLRSPELAAQLVARHALFYWNAEEKVFNEPWDLHTVEIAVESILRFESQLNCPTLDFPLNVRSEVPVLGPEQLLSFVKLHLPREVKKMLVLQTMRSKDPKALEYAKNHSPGYTKLMSHFAQLFCPANLHILAEIEVALQVMSLRAAKDNAKFWLALRDKLREDYNKELWELMLRVQGQVNSTNLQLKHFIREYEAILSIRGLPDSAEIASFRETMERRLLHGYRVDVLDPLQGLLTILFQKHPMDCNLADLNVFILSYVRLAGSGKYKSRVNILDAIFPPCTIKMNHEMPGLIVREGVVARLAMLDTESQKLFGVNAVLLLDFEHLYGDISEFQELTGSGEQMSRERRLLSFALSVSHLTLLQFGGPQLSPDLIELLEVSFVQGTLERLEPGRSSSDLLLLRDEEPSSSSEIVRYQVTEIIRSVKAIMTLADVQVEIGLLVFPTDTLGEMTQRFKCGIADIQAKDTTALRQEIQRTSFARLERTRLGDWVMSLARVQTSLTGDSFPFNFRSLETITDKVFARRDILKAEKAVEHTFRLHVDECLKYMDEQMNERFEKLPSDGSSVEPDDWNQAQWLIRNEAENSDILSAIKRKLDGIPKDCKPLVDKTINESCAHCTDALASFEEFKEKHPASISILDDYIDKFRWITWLRLLQSSVIIELTFHSGLTPDFIMIFDRFYKQGDSDVEALIRSITQEMIWQCSDCISSIPAKRLMVTEVDEAYVYVPHLRESFATSADSDSKEWDVPPYLLPLKSRIATIPVTVLKAHEQKVMLYEFGMVHEIKEMVQSVLAEWEKRTSEDFPTPELRWAANLYALHLFLPLIQEKEREAELSFSPVKVLENYKANIEEEIRKRVGIRQELLIHSKPTSGSKKQPSYYISKFVRLHRVC